MVIKDEYLQSELLNTIQMIMENQEKHLLMSKAMRSLHIPSAAENIAKELLALSGERAMTENS